MTDLRIAAQQALEALKMMRDEYEEYACPACDHADAAIYALRAALVEDAMQKFTDVSQEIEAALAEPVPVAWALHTGTKQGIKWNRRVEHGTPLYTAPHQPSAEPVQEPVGVVRTLMQVHADGTETWKEEPVWAAPPQRKPLTEEEIARLVTNDMVKFARAIEAKHGIGVDK